MNPKLVTYASQGIPRAGLLIGETVVDAAECTGNEAHANMNQLLADWGDVGPSTVAVARGAARGMPLASLRLLAPIPHPGAIYCAGANYVDHIVEMRGPEAAATARSADGEPWLFVKSSRTVVGPDCAVAPPSHCRKLDWEAELAVVIGRYGKDLSVDEAMSIVAGYTVANDLSARDLFRRTNIAENVAFHFDWLGQKNFDGACPLGPWIVLNEDIGDPLNLSISLSVNGVAKQSSNTSQMIYNIAEQIAHLSRSMTLCPGDLILTGTPAGVGAGKGEFLKAGDEVCVSIEKIGTLRHTVAAA